MTRWTVITMVAAVCIAFPLAATRSAYVYTLSTDYSGIGNNGPGSTVDWQFVVPSILTSPATIANFVYASLGPGFSSCGTVQDAQLPLADFGGYVALVVTDFTTVCNGFSGAGANSLQALTSPGVYDLYGRASGAFLGTLTISAVLEPTSLSMLGLGLL